MFRSHICNLPPALLAEWPGCLTCYCGDTGVERMDTKIRVSTENWPWRKKFSPPLLSGLEPESFRSRDRRSSKDWSSYPRFPKLTDRKTIPYHNGKVNLRHQHAGPDTKSNDASPPRYSLKLHWPGTSQRPRHRRLPLAESRLWRYQWSLVALSLVCW